MTIQQYRHWRSVAARHARHRGEAEDLLHDALLAAAAAGRTSFSDSANQAWLAGVLRLRASMDARTAVRRHKRETAHVRSETHQDASEDAGVDLSSLPRSTRSVAALLIHGLTREEIRVALRLRPEALRQRIASLRRQARNLGLSEAETPRPPRATTLPGDPDPGPIRQILRHCLLRLGGVGTADPDGHPIVINLRRVVDGK